MAIQLGASSGNAVANQVLSPATFSNAQQQNLTGTIPSVGASFVIPSASTQTAIAAATYTTGDITVDAVTFTASDVLTGTTIAGTAGTMPNNAGMNFEPDTSNQTIPAGYTTGGTIYAVAGSATTSDVLSGVEFSSANGINQTRTMANNGALNYSPATSDQSIPAGYTSGGTIGQSILGAQAQFVGSASGSGSSAIVTFAQSGFPFTPTYVAIGGQYGPSTAGVYVWSWAVDYEETTMQFSGETYDGPTAYPVTFSTTSDGFTLVVDVSGEYNGTVSMALSEANSFYFVVSGN